MAAPAMGYILHVRKKSKLRISEACRILFGDKFTDGFGGIVLDTLFLVSIFSWCRCHTRTWNTDCHREFSCSIKHRCDVSLNDDCDYCMGSCFFD